jgi:hypothetical protein
VVSFEPLGLPIQSPMFFRYSSRANLTMKIGKTGFSVLFQKNVASVLMGLTLPKK